MSEEVDATSAAFELAEERGVDLDTVKGSGRKGRVTKADVEAVELVERPRNDVDSLKLRNQALQHEVSELGRLYELRGRDLTAACKAQAAAEERAEEIPTLEDKIADRDLEIDALRTEVTGLRAQEDRAVAVLEDVKALARLVDRA